MSRPLRRAWTSTRAGRSLPVAVLDGVVDQVGQDPRQQGRIAVPRQAGVDDPLEHQPTFVEFARELAPQLIDQRGEVDRLADHLDGPRRSRRTV